MKDSSRNTNTPLTEKQEHYCRLRAQGYTKSAAAMEAYDVTDSSARRMGWYVEDDQKIKDRIYQLKEERVAAFGLDVDEQIRKYHDLYMEAKNKGDLKVALMCMERIDKIGGFEVKRTENTIKDTRSALKKDNVEDDLKKFSGVLGKHYEEKEDPTDTKH